MIYDHIGGVQDPLKQDLALEFYKIQSKFISILTETHINHDQIHHTRTNWLALTSSLLEIVTQKDACPGPSGT